MFFVNNCHYACQRVVLARLVVQPIGGEAIAGLAILFVLHVARDAALAAMLRSEPRWRGTGRSARDGGLRVEPRSRSLDLCTQRQDGTLIAITTSQLDREGEPRSCAAKRQR
jgi:hypothetical protein